MTLQVPARSRAAGETALFVAGQIGALTQGTVSLLAFLKPARRRWFLLLLKTLRDRAEFQAHFPDAADLEPRSAQRIPASLQRVQEIEILLRARGATDACLVLSEDPAIDERLLPLRSALRCVFGRRRRAFISCLPGRLAYFQSAARGERYLLDSRRPACTVHRPRGWTFPQCPCHALRRRGRGDGS